MTRKSGLNILLVADLADDIAFIRQVLGDKDNESFAIAHCELLGQALTELAAERYDVVLLSLNLADGDGIAAVQRIESYHPSLPVVVMGDSENEDVALLAVQAGAQDYLVKGQGDRHLVMRSLRYAMERKRTEEHLMYLAQFDTLTGLPNRSLFRDRLSRAIVNGREHQENFALMFLDLDHFKSVNDSLGHDAADELLVQVAKRLQQVLRHGDTVARLGGDEFTIILEELGQPGYATLVAEKIIEAMSRSFIIQGNEVFTTVSIGIATYPCCGEDDHSLLQNADAALYNAKAQGRSTYRFFDEQMNLLSSRRVSMVTGLRHAIVRKEFEVHYQPQIDMNDYSVYGMEALVRWRHPQHGLISPAHFIHLLEDTGMVVEVGKWVLEQACLFNASLQEDGLPGMIVSVNLSARQFMQVDLVSMISSTLIETRLSPRYLQLEITESMLVDNVARATAVLRALHTIGVRLSLDDFGTGFSSLSYLKQFPLDCLKLDQAFVRNVDTASRDEAIARAILNLGHGLRLRVVAEGVESREQFLHLQKHGCDVAQGYLFGRPMPEDEFRTWMQRYSPNVAAASFPMRDLDVG